MYAIAHYVALIGLILLLVRAIDATVYSVDLLAGVAIAVLVGLLYPMVVRRMGIAPTHWEG